MVVTGLSEFIKRTGDKTMAEPDRKNWWEKHTKTGGKTMTKPFNIFARTGGKTVSKPLKKDIMNC